MDFFDTVGGQLEDFIILFEPLGVDADHTIRAWEDWKDCLLDETEDRKFGEKY